MRPSRYRATAYSKRNRKLYPEMIEKDKLLILSDNEDLIHRCKYAFKKKSISTTTHPSDLLTTPAKAVIVDESIAGLTWYAFRQPNTLYLFFVHSPSSLQIPEAIDRGIQHIFLWPLNTKRLQFSLQVALQQNETRKLQTQRYRHLKKMVEKDALTKVCSRSLLFEHAEREFHNAKKMRLPFSLMIADIDHFKEINDIWGHLAGDRVLKDFAALLYNHLRTSDFIGRFGGEEFMVILPHTTGIQALSVAKKLVRLTEAYTFPINSHTTSITISIGVATLNSRIDSLEQLFQKADKALYDAKHHGRNQAVLL